MAEITKTVDPNGNADYTSIGAFIAGEAGKYASSDTAIALCKRTGPLVDTSRPAFGSFGCAVRIYVHPDHRHNGKAGQPGSYICKAATSDPIWFSQASTPLEVDGVEFDGTEWPASNSTVFYAGANVPLKITASLIRGGTRALRQDNGNYSITIENSILVGQGSNSLLLFSGYGRTVALRNTFFEKEIYPYNDAANFIFQNSIAPSFPTQRLLPECGHNIATANASAPGQNSFQNVPLTDIFTDPGNGDYTLKPGAVAIDAGADLSAYFTADISAVVRPQGNGWDIGPFEYVEGSGGGGASMNEIRKPDGSLGGIIRLPGGGGIPVNAIRNPGGTS